MTAPVAAGKHHTRRTINIIVQTGKKEDKKVSSHLEILSLVYYQAKNLFSFRNSRYVPYSGSYFHLIQLLMS